MQTNSSNRLRIIFLVKGSLHDGLGHVMRSKTVARILTQKHDVKFLVIGESLIENLLQDDGLDYSIFTNETDAVKSVVQIEPHIIVFDMLSLEESVFTTIPEALFVSLSPIFNHLQEMDLIYHRSEYFPPEYDGFLEQKQSALRCGLKYTIVRDECHRIPTEKYNIELQYSPLSVAIAMGGCDAANKTLSIIETMHCIPDNLIFWVMLGEGYAHSYDDLVLAAKKDNRHEVILCKTNNSMWRILHSCVLGIMAGGIMTYESVYAGLPTINLLESEGRYFLQKELVEKGVCLCAGYPFEVGLERLCDTVTKLVSNREELLKMHSLSKSLIDTKGQTVIASDIEEYYIHQYKS